MVQVGRGSELGLPLPLMQTVRHLLAIERIHMEAIRIPRQVVEAFESSLVHVEWQMTHFLHEKPADIQSLIAELMSSIPDTIVRSHMSTPLFCSFNASAPEHEQQEQARREILIRLIHEEINRKRIRLLSNTSEGLRPPPYDHPALSEVEITEDHLIDIKALDTSRGLLARNGYVFELVPTLPAFNSSYWLTQYLVEPHSGVTKYVRLDPLAVQPLEEYRRVEYKMWVYGVPLDWDAITSLKEEQHGRWMPGPLSTHSAFTDVVWTPRRGEVHFTCEEVPAAQDAFNRGARYFHAILVPHQRCFIHLDGALRFYSPAELNSRLTTHVRKAGKAGRRVKVFRVEGTIDTALWSALVSTFFVWNYDVMNYASGDVPFPSDSSDLQAGISADA